MNRFLIYLILKLDEIVLVSEIILGTSILILSISFTIIFMFSEGFTDKEVLKSPIPLFLKNHYKKLLIIPIVFLFLKVAIPNTKQAIMIYAIPELQNTIKIENVERIFDMYYQKKLTYDKLKKDIENEIDIPLE